MTKMSLEQFGRLLVEHVRDEAIRSCDRRLKPEARGTVAERWRQAAQGSPESLALLLIPDCVDDAIFYLLNAVDQGIIDLRFKDEQGGEIHLSENGEMAGWYTMSDGWISKYSRERFIDDFAEPDPEED